MLSEVHVGSMTPPDPMRAFAHLLERSQLFEQRLLFVWENCGAPGTRPRQQAAGHAAELSIEHAGGVRLLFETGMPRAACALLGAQYDALLRAAWALYAASDAALARSKRPLDAPPGQAAGHLPATPDLLKALEAQAASQPHLRGLVRPLEAIGARLGRAMDALVEGGPHPLTRAGATALPMPMAEDLVRASNGLLHFGFRILVRLAGPVSVVRQMEQAWVGFEDCCPTATQVV
jgi:hypothetical protein